MSYTVLARKFRSRTFDEVIGQGAITATLKNAIAQDRVHHGYLFCGTRGVGKTSMARILAKALNCLCSDKPTASPCGTCDACEMIARGEDIDVVEIDAASNTGVDNIRELRSNAVFRPTRCRYKIYIIDEVHMLSTGAFNALLKTLEEPPSHVKFILATTEVQKVPATILSRVQRFDFKSITPAEIAEQLASICKAEGVEAEPDALKRLARLANGSMRDALSLLDQVMSMGRMRVSLEIVNELLPVAHDELFAELIDRLADGDAGGAVAVLDRSLSQGRSLDVLCGLLIGQIRDLMMLRICGAETDLVDVPAGLRTRLVEQAARFDSGAYVYMITVLEELRRSVKSSGSGRALVEAAIIRLAESSKFSSIESLLAQLEGGGVARTTAVRDSEPKVAKTLQSTTPPAVRSSPSTSSLPPVPATPAVPAASSTRARRTARPEGAQGSPATTPAPTRRVTQADLKAAASEPMVRAAMEVFGGQIVDVQRSASASTPTQDSQT